MGFHKNLIGDDLHGIRPKTTEVNPVGSITPEYEGEVIVNTDTNVFYRANGLTNVDWNIVGGAGDVTTLSGLSDISLANREDETILAWNGSISKYEHIADMQGKNAGVLGDQPTFTDNGDGTLTVSDCEVVLYDNALNQGKPASYSVTGDTFTLTPDLTNYIIVDYNSGSPIYRNITNVDLINESSTIPIKTAFKDIFTDEIYLIQWDSLADGLANKLHMRFVKTNRFSHEEGIAISESAGRIVNTTSGIVWYGAVRTDILAFTSATDSWSFWYHSGGVWTEDQTTTTYNNTQYDDGTNLVAAPNNKYIINWIFRCSCNPARGAYVLGNEAYDSIAEAKEAEIPELPPLLQSIMFVVGRIIVEKNGTTADSIDSAFVDEFASSGVTLHNNLGGLNNGDFQHLTQAEYEKAQSVYSEKTADYTLLTTDYTIGVVCSTQDLTMTLFSAADLPGKVVNIKKLDGTGYSVDIFPQTGETIDGDSSKTIEFQWTTLTLQSTGTNWIIL